MITETELISVRIGKRTLELETGRIARQANGAVLLGEGNTVILAQGDRVYIINTETQVIAVYDMSKKNLFVGGRRYDFDMEYLRLKGELPFVQNGWSAQTSSNAIRAINSKKRRGNNS